MINLNATGALAQRDPWIIEKENYREVVQYVNAGKLVLLEIGLSHRKFRISGMQSRPVAENLARQREFHSMVDIALAREKQVTPLPLLGEPP